MDYSLLLAIEEITSGNKKDGESEVDILDMDYGLNVSTSSFTDKYKRDTIFTNRDSAKTSNIPSSGSMSKNLHPEIADNKRLYLS